MTTENNGENNCEELSRQPKCIEFSEEQIAKMTPEQLNIASIELSAYALYIQKIVNRHHSLIKRQKRAIDWIVVSYLNQQQAFMRDDKWLLAVKENPKAKELYAEMVQSEIKVEQLNYISKQMCHLADKYDELAKTLRGKKYG